MVKVTIETESTIYQYVITEEMTQLFPDEWLKTFSYPLFLSHVQYVAEK